MINDNGSHSRKHSTKFSLRALAGVASLALVLIACGAKDETGVAGGTGTQRPTVMVTTNILGDVVENLVGEEFDVVTIMPIGANPHDFQASAQQVAEIGEADVLVVNGGGFEEGLLDVIEAVRADGVPVFEAISAVDTIELDQHTEEGEHADEHEGEHEEGEHADEHEGEHEEGEHAHKGVDPHFWSDPARMARTVEAITEFLVANVDGIDVDALRASAESYVAELELLDTEVVETLAPVDAESRVLVTNHHAFGYFADRYEFEVAGTVIPSGSTADGTNARQMAELAEVIEHEGAPVIFSETTLSDELAQTLAAEVGGDITVVALYTGSLGETGSDGDTYVAMVRTNAQRIAEALGG